MYNKYLLLFILLQLLTFILVVIEFDKIWKYFWQPATRAMLAALSLNFREMCSKEMMEIECN